MINYAFLETCYTGEIKTILRQFDDDPEVNTIMILSCDSPEVRNPAMDVFIRTLSTNLLGGIFPEIIVNSKSYQNGILIIGYGFTSRIFVVPGLSKEETNFEKHLEDTNRIPRKNRTALVFSDGLASRIGDLVETLYHKLGEGVNFLGGGAGSLSLQRKACIFSNIGLIEDAAVIAVLKSPSSTGISHGWSPISETIKVTKSTNNIVEELDNRPAFDVYKEVVGHHLKQAITEENFLSLAKAYPLGMIKPDGDVIIRDPIHTENSTLKCVGQVPTGSNIQIFNGTTEALLNGAREAYRMAKESLMEQPKSSLVFDCISRRLFLGDKFDEELPLLKTEVPQFGALSFGEFANKKGAQLDFHNKTTVVSLLY